MGCPRFLLVTAIVCTPLLDAPIAQAVNQDPLKSDYSHYSQSTVDRLEWESILDPVTASDLPKQAHLLAQTNDLQQLFVPQYRRQPGRTPFEPNQVPLKQPATQDPGVSLATPSGYGAAWRSLGIGVGIQSRTRYTHKADGGLGIGMGFGNPAETVGVQVGLGLVDLSDPFADGTFSLKLHRQLPEDVAIAIGGNGILTWGSPDGGTSVYGVVTKRFTLKDSAQEPFSQITTSFGIGSGQFRSESDVNQGKGGVGAFGSVAVRLAEPVSGIVEWTGQDLNLGVSIIPFRKIPLVITPAVNDVTGSAGDGARFVVGIGYGINF